MGSSNEHCKVLLKYYQCYYMDCFHGLVLFIWPMELIVINLWLYDT